MRSLVGGAVGRRALQDVRALSSSTRQPTSRFESICQHIFGIPLGYARRIVVGGLLLGAGVEAFMIKAWIGKTNFYETVKRKEAERVAASQTSEQEGFSALVRQQWEERKKEMAAAQASNK